MPRNTRNQLTPSLPSADLRPAHQSHPSMIDNGLELMLLDTQYRMHPAISEFPRWARRPRAAAVAVGGGAGSHALPSVRGDLCPVPPHPLTPIHHPNTSQPSNPHPVRPQTQRPVLRGPRQVGGHRGAAPAGARPGVARPRDAPGGAGCGGQRGARRPGRLPRAAPRRAGGARRTTQSDSAGRLRGREAARQGAPTARAPWGAPPPPRPSSAPDPPPCTGARRPRRRARPWRRRRELPQPPRGARRAARRRRARGQRRRAQRRAAHPLPWPGARA
jgi:hypothetical protein